MPVINNYDRINNAFERAVKQLQDNLQYLADNDKMGEKFISMQNAIIKALIDYQQQTEYIISSLEMDITGFTIRTRKLREYTSNSLISFEAICIIHGITDFPVWMNKGSGYLISEAVELHKENMITLPYSLREWMDRLPDAEREAIQNILFKNFDKQQQTFSK